MGKELIERQTLEQLIQAHDDALDHAEKGLRHLACARDLIASQLGDLHSDFLPRNFSNSKYENPLGPAESRTSGRIMNEVRETVRGNFWSYAVRLTGIDKLMGPRELDRFHDMLQDKAKLPPFDTNNILATLQGLVDSRPDIFVESVKEAFGWLRQRTPYPHHKTNRDAYWKITQKVIVERVVEYSYGYFRLNFHDEKNLGHLDRVFHALDGQGAPKYPGDLVTRITQAMRDRSIAELETRYFRVKWFKAGTLHIWFLRDGLLQEFNRIAGEHSNEVMSNAA